MTRLTRRISSDFSYPVPAKLLETHPLHLSREYFPLLISLNAVPPILSFSQNRRVLTQGNLVPRSHSVLPLGRGRSGYEITQRVFCTPVGIFVICAWRDSLFTVKFENVPGQSKLVNRITAFVYISSEINRIFFPRRKWNFRRFITKSFVYAFLLNSRENYCTLIGGAEISQRLKAEGIVEYMIRQFHGMFRSWWVYFRQC